jgi:hypothetical protein
MQLEPLWFGPHQSPSRVPKIWTRRRIHCCRLIRWRSGSVHTASMPPTQMSERSELWRCDCCWKLWLRCIVAGTFGRG